MRSSRSVLTVVFSICVLSGCITAGAGAYATIALPPNPSTTSGLPDGRVYEEVSPVNKHGYQAGANGFEPELKETTPFFSIASPDGNAVTYGAQGPASEANASGLSRDFVAEHTPQGWTSRSTTARGEGLNEKIGLFSQQPQWRDYTPDLSHLVYAVIAPDVQLAPLLGSGNYYLMGSNPFQKPTWLFDSVSSQALSEQVNNELVGISPDASVIYVDYEGRLLPQDASRSGPGLYEWRNGVLREAGVLPDGSVPATGARPPAAAASVPEVRPGENNPASLDNGVSENGLRVLFVSADELYVHEIEGDGSERSVLVSASQLAGHFGEAAPDGVALFENLTKNAGHRSESAPTYAYASPDGSHIFFQSIDQLTTQAPAGSEPKVYDFDTDTGGLDYLPGVALGGIVTAAKDGSSFVFVNGSTSPRELDLWSAGANGGSVIQIAQLPGGGFVGPGRLVAGDSVLVFQASAPIAGFNDAGGEQIYRYDIKTNELGCISCPPAGIKPSGNAYLSAIDQYASRLGLSIHSADVVNDARGVSSDGMKVFFDSPDPLVARDTNGQLDTYEWENGNIFLISAGTSREYSLFLDNGESGGDVFFATEDELVEGDNDTGFDVYDARVPRPGDNPPPSAVPCSGDVCQGPPSVAELLGAPPSATFNGAGNIAEQPASKSKSTPKALSRAQKLADSLHVCRKNRSRHKRAVCEKRARKRYSSAGKTAKRGGKENR
jgi:hypothetical protein